MLQLINAFWNIALFRRGPQDLPASSFLLYLTAAFYFLVSLAVVFLPLEFLRVLFSAALDTLLLAALTAAALTVRRRPERIAQALSAIYGTLGLLGLIMLPVTGWLVRVSADPAEALVPLLAFWVLYFWSIAALGHILRHALSIPLLPAVLISYVYFQFWAVIAPSLIGGPAAG